MIDSRETFARRRLDVAESRRHASLAACLAVVERYLRGDAGIIDLERAAIIARDDCHRTDRAADDYARTITIEGESYV